MVLRNALLLPLFVLASASVALGATAGCAAKLASPFDQMAAAQPSITVLRLQNFEAPQQAGATATPQAAPMQLPPQIQQWLQAGAQMLPPGLLPPNLVPGAQAAPLASNVPRYQGFPILATAQVTDPKARQEIFDILGKQSSWVQTTSNCMYAEFGIGIAQPNMPNAEILISLSCAQVQAFNMPWPHGRNGISPETAKRLVAVMQKSFGG